MIERQVITYYQVNHDAHPILQTKHSKELIQKPSKLKSSNIKSRKKNASTSRRDVIILEMTYVPGANEVINLDACERAHGVTSPLGIDNEVDGASRRSKL